VSPRQLIDEEQPSRVRITRSDGTQLTVVDPFVRNDSIARVTREDCLISPAGGGRFGCQEATQTILPLSDVAGLEVRATSWAPTVAAVLVGVVVVGAMAFWAWASSVEAGPIFGAAP
jgi:hypothetical protein